MEDGMPGMLRYMDPSDPGMHTTDTIDFEVVLEGTVTLELDDGATVTLQPGDTVVQNGTRHRWGNPGNTTARLAVFMTGANHDGVPPAT
jgi:quercetin dioxygenase-like cupin family protein